jgi:hypothetical protein
VSESRFWRIVAAGVVAGLFYVGHGLHGSKPFALPLPSLASEARADSGGVAAIPYLDNHSLIVTCSEDGQTIYVWNTSLFLSNSTIEYVGTYRAKP